MALFAIRVYMKPYLENNSCKRFIVTLEVGILHFEASGQFKKKMSIAIS